MNTNKIRQFKCLGCNKTVHMRRPPNRISYCSIKCYRKAKIRPHSIRGKILKCGYCGKNYYRIPSQIKGSRFCGRKCQAIVRNKSLRKGNLGNCLICGKTFWRKPTVIANGNGKFCSKKCYFEWQKGKNKLIKNPYNKTGKNNPNWQGGITPINFRIRNSRDYRKWRLSVFKRDNWTCRKCHKRSKKNEYIKIEAHHIKPFAIFPELRFKIDNGLTLCKKCHDKEPKGKQILYLY